MKESLSKNDNSNSDLCEQGLPIERCTGCVLEAPCSYQKMIKNVKEEYEREIERVMKEGGNDTECSRN